MMMWSQICAPLSWNGVDEWVVVGRLFFKKGIHNPAVITSLHHVLQILQIDACCAEALPWCSPSIYSQSRHCKHCNHFGSTAVRTEHRVKFGEKRATAVAGTAGWATDKARDRRRRGVFVIFIKCHVNHVPPGLTLKFVSCQAAGSRLGAWLQLLCAVGGDR